LPLPNNASIAAGMNGVDEAVGVSAVPKQWFSNSWSGRDVGVTVIVRTASLLELKVGVGDGGKYSYASGQAINWKDYRDPCQYDCQANMRQPPALALLS